MNSKTAVDTAAAQLTATAMKIGGAYNWKHAERDQLIYLGKAGAWHQFRKIGDPRTVWCEVLDAELHMIEATKAAATPAAQPSAEPVAWYRTYAGSRMGVSFDRCHPKPLGWVERPLYDHPAAADTDGPTNPDVLFECLFTPEFEEMANNGSNGYFESAVRRGWDAAVKALAPAGAGEPTADFERECADTDKLLTMLGLNPDECRTDGGSLNLSRIRDRLSAGIVTDEMVSRFLGWKLPEDFHPDAGISFKREFNESTPWPMKHEPTGTNLLSADQAREMLEYVLGAGTGEPTEPSAPVAPWPDFKGQPIRHGARMTHPHGDTFVAVRLNGFKNEGDAWRAIYEEPLRDGQLGVSRLCLQIGDKGQAVLATPVAGAGNPTEPSADAARYQLLRRGQHWSVINGIGDTLRADALDSEIDAILRAGAGEQPSEAPWPNAREKQMARCLGFFASVIKSGEPWTEECQREYDEARATPVTAVGGEPSEAPK